MMPLPLRTAAQILGPSPSTRFDYADVDPAAHRLFVAQLGASRLLEIDTTIARALTMPRPMQATDPTGPLTALSTRKRLRI